MYKWQGKTTALQQFKYILLTTRYEKQQVENAEKNVSLKFCHVICFVVRARHALDVFKGCLIPEGFQVRRAIPLILILNDQTDFRPNSY